MFEAGLTRDQILGLAEQHGHLGFWRVDLKADALFWSDEVFRIHGLRAGADKLRVEDAIKYYHPDDRAMVESAVNVAAESGKPFEFYGARIIQPSGNMRYVFARGEVRRDANGSPAEIYGVFRDVTDEKHDADALRSSEERFRLAALGASVGIWDWVSVDGEALYWSDQFYKLIGYARGELTSDISGFQALLHPADVEPTFTAILDHMEHRAPYRVEYRLKHKTKGYRWFLVTGQAGWDVDGNTVRMVGSVQDIHEQKTAQTNLADANRELTQFASIASHDLQEPLRKISSFSALLEKELGDDLSEKAALYLGFLEDAAQRMHQQIADLLEYTSAGAEAVRVESMDVKTTAQQVWQDHSTALEGVDAEIDAGNAGTLRADSGLLQRLLLNLIGNSIKYRHPHRPLRVTVSTTQDDEFDMLEVRDNGLGFDPKFARKIFAIFGRLHSKDAIPGTGLGLALSERIVRLHGGSISATGEPGNGAVFTARFPRR